MKLYALKYKSNNPRTELSQIWWDAFMKCPRAKYKYIDQDGNMVVDENVKEMLESLPGYTESPVFFEVAVSVVPVV